MKVRKSFLLLLILVLLPKAFSMLSVEEAMDKIRQLEGMPDLKLVYLGLDVELGDDFEFSLPPNVYLSVGEHSILPWPCYVFKTDYQDNSICRYYVLDPLTGQITQWCNPLAVVSPNQGSVEDVLPKEQFIQSAIDFIKKWHNDFDPSLYHISAQVPAINLATGETFYTPTQFVMFRIPPSTSQSGLRIINKLSLFAIRMDSTTGQVVSFFGWHFLPVSVSLTPTISAEQARDIALNLISNRPEFPYIDYADAEVYGLAILMDASCPNYQRLTWGIGVYTCSDNPQYQEDVGSPEHLLWWGISVDAHTGEVVDFQKGLGLLGKGGKAEITKEKLERFKKAAQMKTDWKLMWKVWEGYEQVMYLVTKGRKFYITPEQAWKLAVFTEEKESEVELKYKDKKVKLNPNDVLRKDGKLYLPLEAVLKVAGYSAKYVPKERTIYIEKINKKKEKAQGAIGGGLSLSALGYAFWKFLKLLT